MIERNEYNIVLIRAFASYFQAKSISLFNTNNILCLFFCAIHLVFAMWNNYDFKMNDSHLLVSFAVANE